MRAVSKRHARVFWHVLLFFILISLPGAAPVWAESGPTPPCENPGWFPEDMGLKDHTVFWYDGLYYLASIYLAPEGYEQQFAYASSPDLCTWTDLGGILKVRVPGTWDEWRIWSPQVYKESGTYYMYYTGVTNSWTQSIMLYTSTNPADPLAWHRVGMVFQPSHVGMIWRGAGYWSDSRDPMVGKFGNQYHLYYTGRDEVGGIVGLAKASSPLGPWSDFGAVALASPGCIPESPVVVARNGGYYLFYNDAKSSDPTATCLGEVYRYASTPSGPWSEPRGLRPGWAHEIWAGTDEADYTSYQRQGAVEIRSLTWDTYYDPPRPFIGSEVYHTFIPLVVRTQ